MAIFLHAYIGLAGVQVFFLLSRGIGADWGVFAPGGFGRWAALGAALSLTTCAVMLAASGAQGAVRWGVFGVSLLWFLLLALAPDEGERSLWRPVAGAMAAVALALAA